MNIRAIKISDPAVVRGFIKVAAYQWVVKKLDLPLVANYLMLDFETMVSVMMNYWRVSTINAL